MCPSVSESIRQALPDDAPALARMRWHDSTEDGMAAARPHAEFATGFAEFLRSALASDQ